MSPTQKPLAIVLAKLAGLCLIAWLASLWLPFQTGTFAFPEVLQVVALPEWVKVLGYFDGIHYLNIAQHGYYSLSHAFFPLYPLLIALGGGLTGHYFLVGLLISQICLWLSLLLLRPVLRAIEPTLSQGWVLAFLLAFPTAFFLQSIYTESLFLLLVIATFGLLTKRQWWAVSLVAALAALTRINGVLLILPLALAAYQEFKRTKQWWLWVIPVFPLIGLGIYMIYLHLTAGDALAFLHAQASFGAGRSSQLILLPQVYWRYLKIFLDFNSSWAYWRSWLEMLCFTGAMGATGWFTWQAWVKKHWLALELGIFSLASLILPTLTGTFLSMPRFVCICLPLFIWLAQLKNSKLKLTLVIISSLLQIGFFALFSRGYFLS